MEVFKPGKEILFRVLGIDASRQWYNFYLREGKTPQSAKKRSIMLGIAHFFVPIYDKMDLQHNITKRERPQVSNVLPVIFADGLSDIGFILLGISNPLLGVGSKLGYNLVVEAVPDALRAVRRNFTPSSDSGLDY